MAFADLHEFVQGQFAQFAGHDEYERQLTIWAHKRAASGDRKRRWAALNQVVNLCSKRLWQACNRETARAASRRWQKANREKKREYQRRWRAKHKAAANL